MAFTKTTHRANLRSTVLRPRGEVHRAYRTDPRIEVLAPPAPPVPTPYPSPKIATTKEQSRACAPNPHRFPDPRAHPRRAGRRGGQAPDRRRLDLSASTDAETRQRLPQGLPEDPRAAGQRRAVGHRHQRRRQRQPRRRRLIARPDQRRRPRGTAVHQARPRRRVRDHQRQELHLQPLPAGGRRHLHREDPTTGAKCRARRSPARSTCSSATAPPVPRTPSSTYSSANT